MQGDGNMANMKWSHELEKEQEKILKSLAPLRESLNDSVLRDIVAPLEIGGPLKAVIEVYPNGLKSSDYIEITERLWEEFLKSEYCKCGWKALAGDLAYQFEKPIACFKDFNRNLKISFEMFIYDKYEEKGKDNYERR